ncbi:nucleotidyltransferase family protein [Candidatus Woesearchaeota archaeon]|nr:nucleotidyltransferase family protein [Candidatus Woesearchaeota archaeon]
MYAIILAAGYATRLHPLTENVPKALLRVAEKPIIEHIMARLEELSIIKAYVITNDKFYSMFLEWLHNFDAKAPVEIINDGTKSNDDRLGAIGDMNLVIKSMNINDDILVIASDNIFDFSLKEIANFFKKVKSNLIVLYDVKDYALAKHYGVVEIKGNIVVNFEEKPSQPKSTLISTGIYLFQKKTLPLIPKYIEQGNSSDKTGNFIEWLHKRDKVYSYTTDKTWYDIGNLEQLEKADKYYKK